MVHSHLSYGIVIWGNTHDNHLKELIILQNKAVKIRVVSRAGLFGSGSGPKLTNDVGLNLGLRRTFCLRCTKK